MHTWLSAIEASALAQRLVDTPGAIAVLSAVHVLAFTVLMGCVVVANARLFGWMLGDQPLSNVVRPVFRALMGALIALATTGAFLAMPRATHLLHNFAFVVKLSCAAVALLLQARLAALVRRSGSSPAMFTIGAVATIGWFGAALAACAFLLLE